MSARAASLASSLAEHGGDTARRRSRFALEGGVFMGGATVQWLRDGLGIIEKSADIEALAASVPDTGDVYLVPAFAGLGAPQWDAAARGTIVGLTRGSNRAHLARAALESIAFQTADLIEAMQQDCGQTLAELRVDGGAARNDLLLQFQADLLGVPVLRPINTETTAFGAAALAGLGVGLWQSEAELASLWHLERRFEPRMGRPEPRAPGALAPGRGACALLGAYEHEPAPAHRGDRGASGSRGRHPLVAAARRPPLSR